MFRVYISSKKTHQGSYSNTNSHDHEILNEPLLLWVSFTIRARCGNNSFSHQIIKEDVTFWDR